MKIKPLQWSNAQEPNDKIWYHHICAETPFGIITITWKGWKETDWPTLDNAPWDDFHDSFSDLEEAKRSVEERYMEKVKECLISSPDDTRTCGTCRYRGHDGYCTSDKLTERNWAPADTDDTLIYDYSEGGGFWVGENFGCIHYHKNDVNSINH